MVNVFNKSEEVHCSVTNKNLMYNSSKERKQQYELVLRNNIVDLDKLKQLAWNGVP